MGEYKEAEWYDQNVNVWIGDRAHYGPVYNLKHWWSLRFKKTWDLLTQNKNILEIGHGAGTFAAYCWHHGHRKQWVGVDFGTVGMKMATIGNEKHGHQDCDFFQADFTNEDFSSIMDDAFFDEYGGSPDDWMVLGMEILEHLPNDKELVRSIPKGVEASFTVPGFDANGHLRHFPNPEDATSRYFPELSRPKHHWINRPGRRQNKWHHLITGMGKG